jgi:acetyl-CoA carboxylase carboxyltransferase component
MHIEGGVAAAYRREIDAAPDPEAKRQEIEARLNELRSPFRTAHAFAVEDIIDPRETRPLLVDFIHEAQDSIRAQLGQTSRIPFLP